MKKALIVLAVAGAFTSLASAQTSVSIFGVVDGGLVIDSGGAGGSVTKLGTGVWSSNRIGFRGTEDLGGGVSMLFHLENGFNLDTGTMGQGGLLFGRQAFAGIKGGFGTLTFGRQYTPLSWAQYVTDPFDAGSAGATYNVMQVVDHRRNNTIRYQNKINGFILDGSYSFGEVPGNTTAGRQIDGLVGYENGPISVKLGYFTKTNAADTVDTTKKMLTASYDFKVVKTYLQYIINRDEPSMSTPDSNDMMVGLTAPVGTGTARISYLRREDKAGANDANQIAIGYTHPISKRTMLYTAFARIDNKNAAAYTVGNSSDPGTGDKQFNLGVRHTF